ncbi:two-component system, response regulator YesN [Paenibacillus sp. UNCCL117]|uniref:response regulator transcription factor n=1 Tax=unclassified Paenibacillus TaxID=185978 RepID=UPI0008821615|nr:MULTISPECIES: response regulator [unclassified Paenibacillus]SDD40901.1 two-component system, response regulator YesN [Paenibacillus sp. cl123]SFW47982.1 two-component system, response regulator YesN [Paenibacillus sp. UNCCL117]
MYTVLVAENEPWVLKGIVKMVEEAGEEFEVVGACSNGEEAWSMIQEVWPMLLITDIMMPDLDGLSLCKRIKEHQLSLVSIIVSGYDNFQYAQKAMTYGVSEYLLKPLEFELLAETLNRSKEKLESLKHLNSYIVKFQTLLDNRQGLQPKLALNKQIELFQAVLRMGYIQQNVRVSLLNIFEHKLKMLLEECDVSFKDAPPYDASDDESIIRYYTVMLEKWYLSQNKAGESSMPKVIEQSCRYIKENFKEEITLTEMAALTNFSVSHFSTLFKKHTGSSLVNYVNGIKIEEAKKLLLSTSYSVSEITEIVGFSTTPYFSRVFKTTVGLSPLEYRKRMGT